MSEPFLGQISTFSFNFAPKGWAQCNGQLLPINQNQALFALLGTTYGGNGTTNFALPNLQGRVGMHVGNGHVQGERAGEENATLSLSQMPAHTHTAISSTASGTQTSPANGVWAQDSGFNAVYSTVGGTTLNPRAIGLTGGSQPHTNLAPCLTLNYCIALQGIFPSRN